MLYKEDWDIAVKRMDAWFDGKIIDRPAVQIYAPGKKRVNPAVPQPENIRERWLNVDWVIANTDAWMASTCFMAEALPTTFPNMGPDIFAAFFGCDLEFAERTSWSHPIIRDWDNDMPQFKLDRENKWWKIACEMTSRMAEAASGKYVVGLTDLHPGSDGLAALRGGQNLCLDLYDYPEKVKEAMAGLKAVWAEVYEGMRECLAGKIEGTTTWLGLWCPGKYYVPSSDFSCMISVDAFKEFFLDELVNEIEGLDRSIYHLDGPGALKHLDTLLGIEKLNAIQWVPGEGSGPYVQWVPVIKKIQQTGKSVHITLPADEIEGMTRELSPEGVMFATFVNSEEEGENLLSIIKSWK